MSKRLSSLFIALIIFLSCVLVAFTGLQVKQELTGSSGDGDSSGSNTTAISDSDVTATNYLASYYTNLTYNLPNNPGQFCVFVSLAMMLSYFDTYWDDTIIEDKYELKGNDIKSPGAWSNFPANKDDYSAYYDTYKDSDFMIKIMKGYNIDNFYSYKVDNGNIAEVIEKGLQNINKVDSFDIVMTTSSSDAKNYFNNDIPVMIIIEGHALVGFDYDAENEVYYGHNGYRKNSSYARLVTVPKGNVKYMFAIVPKDTSEHVCSNNYYTSETYVENFCPCFLDEHPHQSQHTYTYDSSTHTYLCDEKVISTGSHGAYTYTSISDSKHYVYCKCGYNLTQSHWYYYPKVIAASTTSHYLECVKCGKRWSEQHFAMYYTEESSTRYNVYCYCGVYMYYTTSKPSGLYLKT
jgi:hypothetical protein